MGLSWHIAVAVGCSLSASLAYAYGSALLHRATGLAQLSGVAPRALADFVRSVARNPGWLVAVLVDVAGFVFHAIALHEGTLVLVQPLLVSSLVFALVVRRRLDHRPVVPAEIRWAVVLVAGLGLFLVTVSPVSARPQSPDPMPTVTVTVVSAVVLLGALVQSRRGNRDSRPMLLGLSAGISSAAAAALIKTTGNVLMARGPGAMLAHWSFWAAVVDGLFGVALTQLAFQAGPLSASLPAMQTANPVLSVVIGIAIYDEPLSRGAPLLATASLSLLVTLLAVVVLSRRAPGSSPGTSASMSPTAALSPATARAPAPAAVPAPSPGAANRFS